MLLTSAQVVALQTIAESWKLIDERCNLINDLIGSHRLLIPPLTFHYLDGIFFAQHIARLLTDHEIAASNSKN